MANVLNRTTRQYLQSVNTPDYSPDEWIINPDLSSVANVASKYWKVTGDSVTEMTAEEKATVDAPQPKTEIYPFEFQSLLTDSQLAAIQTATDPLLIRMRTKIQTIVTPMPFVAGSELWQGVAYLGYVMPELFTPSEVERILSGVIP